MEKFAWYDFGWDSAVLPANKFPFGHRIILGMDCTSGEAYARVSLYSIFDLAIRFGKINPNETATLLIDIDPLAEGAPGDLHEEFRPGVALVPVGKVSPNEEIARERVVAGVAQLLCQIMDRHWDATARELLPAINGLRSASMRERFDGVRKLLSQHEQRILNLVTLAIENIRRWAADDPASNMLIEGLELFAEPDPSSFAGITRFARESLVLLACSLAEPISQHLETAELTSAELRQYLDGKGGISIVGQTMVALVQRELLTLVRQHETEGPASV